MLTPQLEAKNLATAIDLLTPLFLKREDLHPYSSHKGRSIPVMIEKYIQEGCQNFCISSSGNAALAAIYSIKKLNTEQTDKKINLHIFIGEHIQMQKLERLEQIKQNDNSILIKKVSNPKQSAFLMEKENKAKNLRQSTDDSALIGYQTLADELARIQNLSAIFIPTSSGTTAQGLYDGFKKHDLNPQIHVVQTPKCHPLIDNSPIGESIANAIVDTVGYRKEAIQKILQQSGGKGWIAGDKDIVEAQSLVKETEDLEISPNSALSLTGLNLAIKNGWKFDGSVVCLITGL
jgi:threonine synthase